MITSSNQRCPSKAIDGLGVLLGISGAFHRMTRESSFIIMRVITLSVSPDWEGIRKCISPRNKKASKPHALLEGSDIRMISGTIRYRVTVTEFYQSIFIIFGWMTAIDSACDFY